MSAVPPYRQYLLLAALPGWCATATGLTEDAAGAYSLDALPGAARMLDMPEASAPRAPIALARAARALRLESDPLPVASLVAGRDVVEAQLAHARLTGS